MAVKFSAIVLLACVLSGAHAQFVPNSSQMFQFAAGYNPAFTGVEPYSDVKLGYRYQWTGFGDAGPKFINLSGSMRLTQPADLITHAPRMSNAAELNKSGFIPAGKRAFHAMGIHVFNESNNLLARTGGIVNYAFHYPLSKNTRLSAGVGAVIENTKLDFDKIRLGETSKENDPFYQYLVQTGASHTNVSIRGGLLVYGKDFYFGVSYLPMVNKVVSTSETSFSEAFYRGTIQAGVALEMSPDFQLKPSILALMQMDNKFAIDYSVKAYIKEKAWFGVTYRDVKASVFLLGFNVNRTFGASYAYEMSMDGFKTFNDGSHELVLSLRFNNFKQQMPSVW
jgi:type IX secretion system PorP/SprF family membrane protein